MLEANGIGYSFLTNNPTRSIADHLVKLERLGIKTRPDKMYTTAVAAIDYPQSQYVRCQKNLRSRQPQHACRSLRPQALRSPLWRPACCLMPWWWHLTPLWNIPRLCHAAWLASKGVPYIATNPDRVCPTDQPTVLVDCGSLCSAIEYATGGCPDIVIGKPNPDMLSGIRHRYGLAADERLPCVATASIQMWLWPVTPERSECWCFQARQHLKLRLHPILCPTLRQKHSRIRRTSARIQK